MIFGTPIIQARNKCANKETHHGMYIYCMYNSDISRKKQKRGKWPNWEFLNF